MNIVLTGDRPTGKLHIGHYVGSLKKRVSIQGKYDKSFIMIADTQALSDNALNPEKVRDSVIEVMLDYLSVGLKPELNTFFIQSLVPELAELTMYYMNFVNLGRLSRNPTVKAEMKQKGYGDQIPVGFLCYPISQAADITAFKANLIPVGDDQLPMIEQTNEIVRRINNHFNKNILEECKPLLSNVKRLPGIDGKSKMSKSLNNAIYLSDNRECISRKVMSMYTDPNHIRIEDPGNIEGNVVFKYLDAFDPNKDEVEKLKKHYEKGGLGDVTIKKRLIEVLDQELNPIRLRRQQLEQNKDELLIMLKEGSEYARTIASDTLAEIKKVFYLNY
ncbi:tryptophan--tRNA ligase [Vallitalea guaymasensis]|uniref:tryptophan--tRNA ligase n=1 Tax=Vallitalea guaymasensis TaxID=1185412 RepID=UPI0023535ABA|nr:tryptophan--tRNA ligase [Vallitalea guaymasensis]